MAYTTLAYTEPITMNTFTEVLPATATSQHNGIRWTPETGRLTINTGRKSDAYRVSEFPADGGRGFHFAKETPGTDREANSYAVFCHDPATPGYDSCECRGFLRHGHCKHLEAVKAILENEFLWSRTEAAPAAVEAEPAPVMTPDEALAELLRVLAIPTRSFRRPVAVEPAKPAARFNTARDLAADAAYRW